MKEKSNLIVSDDIQIILEHKLPWHDFDGSTVIISGASGFLPSYIVYVLSELKERGSNIRIVGRVRNLEKAKIKFSNLLEKIELIEIENNNDSVPQMEGRFSKMLKQLID